MSDPLFPAPPVAPPAEQKPKPPVPRELNIAMVAWVLSAIVGVILQISDTELFVEQYLKQAGSSQEAQLSFETLKTVYVVAVSVIGLAYLLFALLMRAGRNWARILLTVVMGLSLMSQAAAVGMTEVLAVVSVLVGAAAVVFMYLPPANEYFAKFKRPKDDAARSERAKNDPFK